MAWDVFFAVFFAHMLGGVLLTAGVHAHRYYRARKIARQMEAHKAALRSFLQETGEALAPHVPTPEWVQDVLDEERAT